MPTKKKVMFYFMFLVIQNMACYLKEIEMNKLQVVELK